MHTCLESELLTPELSGSVISVILELPDDELAWHELDIPPTSVDTLEELASSFWLLLELSHDKADELCSHDEDPSEEFEIVICGDDFDELSAELLTVSCWTNDKELLIWLSFSKLMLFSFSACPFVILSSNFSSVFAFSFESMISLSPTVGNGSFLGLITGEFTCTFLRKILVLGWMLSPVSYWATKSSIGMSASCLNNSASDRLLAGVSTIQNNILCIHDSW